MYNERTNMSRAYLSPLLALLLVSGLCAQTAGNPFEKAPPDVDAALRDRIAKFYQAHVDKKFRQADQYVAEDTKDFFFAANKPPYLAFRIFSIVYSDNFTKAKVVVMCKQRIMAPGFADQPPMEVPTPDTWKLEDGQWYWYFDVSAGRETPFGRSAPVKPGPADANQSPGIPATLMSLDSLTKSVQANKNAVSLKISEPSSDEVKIINALPGAVKLRLEVPSTPGLKVTLDRTDLKGQEQAKVLFESVAAPNRKPFEVRILVEPLNLVIPVAVSFQ